MLGTRTIIGLAVLGCLALGLRVWAVAGDAPDRPHPPVVSIAAGMNPAGDAMQPTGGAIRKIVQLLQCLLGVATVFALAWLGWSLLPEEPSVGWAAAVGLAVYPGDVHDVVQPQMGLWAAAAVVALLALAGMSRWRTIQRAAILAGCLTAAVGGAWLAGDVPLFGPGRLDRFAAIACVALASIGCARLRPVGGGCGPPTPSSPRPR